MVFTDRLRANESLYKGQSIFSPNGKYEAILQDDGNFVLYKRSPIWASNTDKHPDVVKLCMQYDDNLVIYDEKNPIWASNSWRQNGSDCVLVMQDDGNLVIYRTEQCNEPIWSTK